MNHFGEIIRPQLSNGWLRVLGIFSVHQCEKRDIVLNSTHHEVYKLLHNLVPMQRSASTPPTSLFLENFPLAMWAFLKFFEYF